MTWFIFWCRTANNKHVLYCKFSTQLKNPLCKLQLGGHLQRGIHKLWDAFCQTSDSITPHCPGGITCHHVTVPHVTKVNTVQTEVVIFLATVAHTTSPRLTILYLSISFH